MTLTVLNGPSIGAGQSLSAGLDCSAGDLVRITMPAAWDNAALTFQASSDGSFYNDLYQPDGSEVRMLVKPGTGVLLNMAMTLAVKWLKVRSGTSASPVNQSAQRDFAVTLKTP